MTATLTTNIFNDTWISFSINRFPVSTAASSCWRSKRRISIREDTPFSAVFSEFFGSTVWLRLGSPLMSLNVKERILNQMVSSSKESFLCSSETSLQQKHHQTTHFIYTVEFKFFNICCHQSMHLWMTPASIYHLNDLGQAKNCLKCHLSISIKWAQELSYRLLLP